MQSQFIIGACFALMLSLALGINGIAQDSRETPSADSIPVLTASSPDGEFYLIAGSDGRIKFVCLEDGGLERTIYHCNPRGAVFSSDGKFLATAGLSNGRPAKLKIWNVADGHFLREIETEVHNEIQLCFSPNGKYLASSDSGSRVNLWEVATGLLKQSVQANTNVTHLFFSKHGEILVAIYSDGSTRLISFQQKAE